MMEAEVSMLQGQDTRNAGSFQKLEKAPPK